MVSILLGGVFTERQAGMGMYAVSWKGEDFSLSSPGSCGVKPSLPSSASVHVPSLFTAEDSQSYTKATFSPTSSQLLASPPQMGLQALHLCPALFAITLTALMKVQSSFLKSRASLCSGHIPSCSSDGSIPGLSH